MATSAKEVMSGRTQGTTDAQGKKNMSSAGQGPDDRKHKRLTDNNGEEVERLTEDLIRRRVYTEHNLGFSLASADGKKRKSLKSVVKGYVKQFLKNYDERIEYKSEVSLVELRKEKIRGEKDLREKHPEFFVPHEEREWIHVLDKGKPVVIRDAKGQILFVKVPLKQELIDTLERTDCYVPDLKAPKPKAAATSADPEHLHKRGSYEHRHWITWWDYNETKESRAAGKKQQLILSKEYRRDQQIQLPPATNTAGNPLPSNVVERWFEENEPLFKAVSNTLKMWMPDQWLHMTNSTPTKFFKKAKLPHLASPYVGLALNRHQKKNGTPHLDYNDNGRSPNAIIPFGSKWTSGGDVLLHSLGYKVRVYKGELGLFYGRYIVHNVVDIEGERNVIDLIHNERVRKWAEKRRKIWQGSRKRSHGSSMGKGQEGGAKKKKTLVGVGEKKKKNEPLDESDVEDDEIDGEDSLDEVDGDWEETEVESEEDDE